MPKNAFACFHGKRVKVRLANRLSEAVRGLELTEQESVIRAFALYFQLVNIAEQHHRFAVAASTSSRDESRATRSATRSTGSAIAGRNPCRCGSC